MDLFNSPPNSAANAGAPVPQNQSDTATPPEAPSGDHLAAYAQRAYLEYALSVVKGRALPTVSDGQKPVQRRIVYAMLRMGLGYSANAPVNSQGAKPVKSARVVGDVLGRFHPHGDQAAYDAMVRMAQDFSQRYPLVDGQGNFGSRDGDGAAAMRYTEARLSKISRLLLDEIDLGTVDFVPNYDGSTDEPQELPARLPFALLNGASGIAVGLATEIPSHNLVEIAAVCKALIEDEKLSDDALYALVPGPDFAAGAQLISPAKDIAAAYSSGRGSLKLRARWHTEDLARGQWQIVVDELPQGVSCQKILEEIEELTNPKVKLGKKALSPEQLQTKALVLSVLDAVRDESSKDAPVRLVLEPKSSRIDPQEFTNTLLAHTALESNYPINLTSIGLDGKPVQKSLRQMLTEWVAFRQTTLKRRSEHRLAQVLERIHILEGRHSVLLNIDEVIALIRESDEPKPALMARFNLSDRQAEDILEIRLRQLARLEAIKIEQELAELRKEQSELERVLGSSAALKKLMLKELERDAAAYGDARRTLIQPEEKTKLEVKVLDEPLTLIVSQNGWVRARGGHGVVDAATLSFKAGDALYATFECRSVDTLIGFGSNGRVYSVAAAQLPSGRGDGQPFTSFIELESGTRITHYIAGSAEAVYLLASSEGYGFVAKLGDMVSRQRMGKAFVSLSDGAALLPPVAVTPALPQLLCASAAGRMLAFDLAELKMLSGGKGLMLMDLEAKDQLLAITPFDGTSARPGRVTASGTGRGGKEKTETLDAKMLQSLKAVRGRKGRVVDWGLKLSALEAA